LAGKEKAEELSTDPNAWMVTFGDLITLLLTFFVLLLSMSSMDEQKFAEMVNDSSGEYISLLNDTSFGMDDFNAVDINLVNKLKRSIAVAAKSAPKKVKVELKLEGNENNNSGTGISSEDDGDLNLAGAGKEAQDPEKLKIKISIEKGNIKITLPDEIVFDLGKIELQPEAKGIVKAILSISKEAGLTFTALSHIDDGPNKSRRYPSNLLFTCARSSSLTSYAQSLDLIPADKIRASGFGSSRPIARNDDDVEKIKNRRVEIWLEPMDAWIKTNFPNMPMYIFEEPPEEITGFSLVPANPQTLQGDPSFDPAVVYPDM